MDSPFLLVLCYCDGCSCSVKKSVFWLQESVHFHVRGQLVHPGLFCCSSALPSLAANPAAQAGVTVSQPRPAAGGGPVTPCHPNLLKAPPPVVRSWPEPSLEGPEPPVGLQRGRITLFLDNRPRDPALN